MIRIRNVSKHFGGVYAVHNCSMDIRPDGITAIIGPNGAGKTTLFNLICGITRPDSGKIFLLDHDITQASTHQIAQLGISRTFQQARLFRNLSVRENLLMAAEAGDDELRAALDRVHFPLDLDTRAGDLSYGQMRLVEICRALLHRHQLLMLDEPTAGVNPQVRRELQHILLGAKKQGKAMLLIEHDMDFVGISDEVIVMAEGKVLARGKPGTVRKDPRVLEAYLGT
ncbi:ABC transporter ATP-binding protein [Candidatus Woesearchaeota archaeon]|nr:ABC transporter ATP-binding protein [Candidatus Woesearchaeota archaeon]